MNKIQILAKMMQIKIKKIKTNKKISNKPNKNNN